MISFIEIADIGADLLNVAAHAAGWIKEKRLPQMGELEPIVKTAQSLQAKFKSSLQDEWWLRRLTTRLEDEEGEVDPNRGKVAREFLKSESVPYADRLLFRQLIFSAQELENEEAAYKELCHLLEVPTFPGIQNQLEDYRLRRGDVNLGNPAALLSKIKDRWDAANRDGMLRRMRDAEVEFKDQTLEADTAAVSDEELSEATEALKAASGKFTNGLLDWLK